MNSSDLRFLYESHENFTALPTYFILAGMCMEAPLVQQNMPPGKHADFTNVSIKLLKTLRADTHMLSKMLTRTIQISNVFCKYHDANARFVFASLLENAVCNRSNISYLFIYLVISG